MEVEKYKMIYTKIISEEIKNELPFDVKRLIDIEKESENIRILDNDNVKNNKNKGKRIINNKKYKLKEYINNNKYKDDKRKKKMILNKEISNKEVSFYEKLLRKFPFELTKKIVKINEKDNIRILGNDFVKNNKNKGKLIINNKKYKLKEFINCKEFKDDIIKINMILTKKLSNISHIFENCYKLKEFSFCDDTRFVDDKGPHLLEEYNDYDNDIYFDFNENSPDNCSEHSLYKNIKTDDIYSNSSTITTKAKMKEKHDKMIIINFLTI